MNRDTGNLVFATGVLGISAIAALAVYRHHLLHKDGETWLSKAGNKRFAPDKAAVFRLQYVNRFNSAMIGGASAVKCSDTGRDVGVKDLLDVAHLTLYSVEILDGEVLLMFMEVPSMHDLFELPFLDRGVRKVAKIGSHVYVARLDAVEKIPGLEPIHRRDEEAQRRISIVWNTGRCGSTLMHKMLRRINVLSFSEPFWLDRVCDLKLEGFEDDDIARAFGVCGAMDIMLASRYFSRMPVAFDRPYLFGRANVSFNPKGKDFMCMNPVIRSLPHARHVFMYRDVREVAESFCSIFVRRPSELEKLSRRVLVGWMPSWNQSLELPPPEMTGRPQPIFSRTMAQVMASVPIVQPSMPLARRVCMGWMECMCIWQELNEDDATAEGARLCIRMADYIRKDPEVVRRVLRFVVCHRGDVEDGVVAEAMEAFETHSQKGDKMSTSSFNPASRKPRVLSPEDIEEITALARAVPTIGSPDYMHPDSMWATAGSPPS